jgi:two-component system CheB/CheR fusion protein
VGSDAGVLAVDISVEPIVEPHSLRGMVMVVFSDAPRAVEVKPAAKTRRGSAAPSELARTEQELEQTREELRTARDEMQTTREEMQTSQEELKSSNEELQRTNEELQSTNEELTTSKEEMQSLNEELQTLNHELQAKVDELSRASNDMKNLLDSTEIATLFLDGEMKVRRFTAPVSKIIKLRPSDIDRPLTELASSLVYPDLCDDARQVLRTFSSKEQPITTSDGRWFSVRIMPYRTMDDRIDGVVITFMDITVAKTLEATLRKGRSTKEPGS